ncbi:MAG: hypothetical protein OER88_02440 [Planctomycetota bacterium]|nr:hypothetical protein [Planctomycetota bacterium]
MRKHAYRMFVALAIFTDCVAAYCIVGLNRWDWVLIGFLLHGLAAGACWSAARRRRDDLASVECDMVVAIALLVPVFGPALAWRIPRPVGAKEEKNAHAVFEDYADHVKPMDAEFERTLFTGDYERDLARELDAESYHAVLRDGTIDQKRSALVRLAELGEPKHFQLVRGCLLDPSHEVRLYAYNELERSSRSYEEEIAARSKDLKENPGDADALLSLARTYFGYAASGIHDASMAAFYFQSSANYAEQARGAGHGEPDPVWVRAHALGRLAEYKSAEECLAQLTPVQQELPTTCLVRAELAYRRRDFMAVRREVVRLEGTDAELPDWLKALEVTV